MHPEIAEPRFIRDPIYDWKERPTGDTSSKYRTLMGKSIEKPFLDAKSGVMHGEISLT
jgi:hypothetical protein